MMESTFDELNKDVTEAIAGKVQSITILHNWSG